MGASRGLDDSTVWIATSLLVVATWAPVLRRGWKLPTVTLLAAITIDLAVIDLATPLGALLITVLVLWIGVRIARHRHLQGINQGLRDQYEHALATPGVTGWLVLDVEHGTSSTRCLLENDTTGHRTTRTLWGDFRPGDRVALQAGDTSEEPVVLLPAEAQPRRRRFQRR